MMALFAIVAVTAVALAACVMPGDRKLYPLRAGQAAVPIYIIDNGFHIDFALPRAALARPGSPSAQALAAVPASPWVLVGWGDASYYRGSVGARSRLLDGARALFRPGNASVLRIQPLDRAPQDAYPPQSVTRVTLSAEGFERLGQRLDRSFALGDDAPILVETRPGEQAELYYASVEHFGVGKSCVHWSSQLLNAAGVPAHRFFDGLVVGLMWDLRLRAGVTPHAPSPADPKTPVPAAGADRRAGE